MKRGLITWRKDELPPRAFETRLAAARKILAERDLPALVVSSDVWRSNQARYFSNFMPYWNRALLVIPREDKLVLLCSLSPRVYPWIKSVTILEDIRPSPNLAQRIFEMSAEKGWKTVGVLDAEGLPYDLYSQLHSGNLEVLDVPSAAIRATADEWELSMCGRAEKLAREILAEEMPQGPGLTDHEFVGRLELRFRRAGAEDLILLIANPDTPAPPTGAVLRADFSLAVALEYRGHWVSLAPTGEAQYCLSPAGAEFI